MHEPKLEQLEGLVGRKREEAPGGSPKAQRIPGVTCAGEAIGSNKRRSLVLLDVAAEIVARVLNGYKTFCVGVDKYDGRVTIAIPVSYYECWPCHREGWPGHKTHVVPKSTPTPMAADRSAEPPAVEAYIVEAFVKQTWEW